MKNNRKINWLNTLFLIITPIVGIVGTTLWCVFGLVHWPTWILAGAMTILAGFGITGGYHRLFAHKSYSASWIVRLLYLAFGSTTFQGSALEWSTDHRNHHRYIDSEKDPYNIKKGFWFAHIGWLFTLNPKVRDFSNVKDLTKDPLVHFQHRFYVPLAVLFGFIMPAGIAALWGDPLGGLIIAGALRITFNHHTTFAINSVCHMFGKRNYTDQQTAVDNWVTALFTFGEGYHSFHHKFPIDYRNGIKFYHFDPTKWLIRGLSYCGLTNNLKTVRKHRIIKQQVLMKEKLLQEKLLTQHEQFTYEQWEHIVNNVKNATQHVLQKIEELEVHYLRLIRDKVSRTQRKAYRKQIKSAYVELKTYLTLWKQLQRQSHRLSAA
jgi:stearoyl-CoA desaturase (Delta-9 desaturase)